MTVSNVPNLVVGTGTYVYDVVRPWGLLPAGHSFGLISHVAVDSQDRVYFYQRKDPPILVFDGDGNFLGGWGDGRLRDAHGIYIGRRRPPLRLQPGRARSAEAHPDGRIVLDARAPGPARAPGSVQPPRGRRRGAERRHLRRRWVRQLGRCTGFLRRAGTWVPGELRGPGRGQFTTPHGIWVDAAERVLVADRENNRVQLFSPEGTCMESGATSTIPWTFTSTGAGTVYITDQIPRITCMPPTDRCSPVAGRRPMGATGCGGTPAATSTWPRWLSTR